MNRITRTLLMGKFLKPTKDGGILLLGVNANIVAVFVDVFRQKLLEAELGYKKMASLRYNVGKFTGQQAWDLLAKKKGMEKKMSLRKLFDYNSGQSECIGNGKIFLKLFNLREEIIVVHILSIFAKEYRRIFGMTTFNVDHVFRGMAAAFGDSVFGKPCLCIEKKCIAKGDDICEFVIRPVKRFNLSKQEKKLYAIKDMPSFKELGARKEPYV